MDLRGTPPDIVAARSRSAGLNGAAGLDRSERILHFEELVTAQARRLHKSSFSHVPLEDLIQEGQLGLIKAIDSYDGQLF
jgi:DNA-directed RNA polymerase specialized sigma subunit